ncbi:phosphatase PAP2 family protein [uncultured Martelella sp.]|uniref:phosphatase PAP2 family protein n=1 Tax=uncultured Martelella sp. TaxID=392331 RepID=UPI0029C7ADAB|nr:phosphatase PAP2 family protein [uncultured Martelella sp.]
MTVPYRWFSQRRKMQSCKWPCNHWRGFLVGTLGLVLVSFAVLDYPVGLMSQDFNPTVVHYGKLLTHFGKSDWILFASFLAIIVGLGAAGTGDRRTRAKGVFLAQASSFVFASVAFSGIAVAIIKNLIGRPRPHLLLHQDIGPFSFSPMHFDSDFASFPSGHSTTIAAIFTCAAFFMPRHRVLFFSLAVVIAMCRTIVSAHYPSDVIVGLAFGTWCTYFVAIFFSRYRMVFRIDETGKPVPRNSIKALKPAFMRSHHAQASGETDLDLRAQKGH